MIASIASHSRLDIKDSISIFLGWATRGYPNLDRYPNLDTGGIAKKKMLLLA